MTPIAFIKTTTFFCLFALILIGYVILVTGHAKAANLMLTPAGPARVLFDWKTSSCSKSFIPDAPARMLRRADGGLMLIATNNDNWAMTGPSFFQLRQQCNPSFPMIRYNSAVNGNLWIEATYTLDGKTIYGIASQDLSAIVEKHGCNRGTSTAKCWLNALVGVRSDDTGNNFVLQQPGDDVIASLGRTYQPDWTTREGFFTISNIVRQGSFYYAFVSFANITAHSAGNCLIRTTQIGDPSSWRAWNGKAFAASLDDDINAQDNTCAIIGADVFASEIRSLNFVPSKSLYVAVFAARLRLSGDINSVPGAYYSTSRNLIDWSNPQRLFAAPTLPGVDSKNGFYNYPSLIDPSSKSKNFETIDSNTPILIYIYEHLTKDGAGSMDRDIRYVRLQLN